MVGKISSSDLPEQSRVNRKRRKRFAFKLTLFMIDQILWHGKFSFLRLRLLRYRKLLIQTPPLFSIYPRLTLCLRAPLEIQNLLPYDIRIRVYDKHIEHNWKTFLRKGGVIPMNIAELSHLLLLSVEVQDTGTFPYLIEWYFHWRSVEHSLWLEWFRHHQYR